MGSSEAVLSSRLALDEPKRQRSSTWRPFFRNKGAVAASVVVITLAVAAVLAPVIAPQSPYLTNGATALHGPSRQHLLGTDSLGRDMLSRIIYGARISLFVGFAAVILSLLFGASLGMIGGYLGGFADDLLMRCNDVLMAIPGIVLALAVVAALGPSVLGVVLAITISTIPGDARLARSQTIYERSIDYVTAAQALGCRQSRIIRRHILPNITSVLVVRATTNLGAAILTAAGLSFLGLGVQPPTPTLGRDGQRRPPIHLYRGVRGDHPRRVHHDHGARLQHCR